MIPKIEFRYSWVYDANWKKWIKTYDVPKLNRSKDLSYKVIEKYIAKVEKLWRKDEVKVLTELSKISVLKWKTKHIICYVVNEAIPFSDPLTVSVYLDSPDFFVDVLVHELIHQLYLQPGNLRSAKKLWAHINKKYANVSYATRIHIPLHAMHEHIYRKFFNEKRLKRDIRFASKFLPAYKQAWQIVEKEGYKNIIAEFKQYLKAK